MDERGSVTGVEADDIHCLQYGVKLIQCPVGMFARPGPQIKYLKVLCFVCFNKIEIQSSGSFSLPHLPDVHVQKPSSRQMGHLEKQLIRGVQAVSEAYDYNKLEPMIKILAYVPTLQ